MTSCGMRAAARETPRQAAGVGRDGGPIRGRQPMPESVDTRPQDDGLRGRPCIALMASMQLVALAHVLSMYSQVAPAANGSVRTMERLYRRDSRDMWTGGSARPVKWGLFHVPIQKQTGTNGEQPRHSDPSRRDKARVRPTQPGGRQAAPTSSSCSRQSRAPCDSTPSCSPDRARPPPRSRGCWGSGRAGATAVGRSGRGAHRQR